MEENFKKVIEQITDSEVDQKEVTKYILAIKGVIKKFYDNCKDELSEEEIISQFLEEYQKELEFRGNIQEVATQILMFNAYKRILQDYKGNKVNFDSILRESKKRELADNTERITIRVDARECMISAIRSIIRTQKATKEKDVVRVVQEIKSVLNNELREKMINIVHSSAGFLEEYGFIDEYIVDTNQELEEVELSELKVVKRNPIAEEQYDKETGKLVKDVEDIGVIDALERENIETYPLEDLELITAYWESSYLQERLGISRAMSIINTLDLWDVILHGKDEDIDQIPFSKIQGAFKKDVALIYLVGKEDGITNKMRRQYKKFLKKEEMSTDLELEDELAAILPEVLNLQEAARDITVLSGLIIHQLKAKDFKVKRWGAKEEKSEEDDDKKITIVIDNRNFRRPFIIATTEQTLMNMFGEKIELQEYDNEIDQKYCDIMSKLCLPMSGYYKNKIEEAYRNNPQSKVYANLAGRREKTDVKEI